MGEKSTPSANVEQLAPETTLLIAALLLVDSLHFVFARALLPHLPPAVSAFFVLAVATVETAVFLAVRGRIQLAVLRRNAPFFLAIGALVAASTVINYNAVNFVDPGTAALLGKTSILFALLLGWLWLGDRLNGRQQLGAVVALVGVFTISFQPVGALRLGALMVLSSAFMYALHAALTKRHAEAMDLGNFFLFRVATTALFLGLFAGLSDGIVWPSGAAWPLLLLAGTVDVVISRVLYYQLLRRVRISLHAVVLTLSPAVTILWSLVLFGTRPSPQGLVGGAAVIVGVLIVARAGQRRRAVARAIGD